MKFKQFLKGVALCGVLTLSLASWTTDWAAQVIGLKGEVPAPTFTNNTCTSWVKVDVEVTTRVTPVDARASLNDLERLNLLPTCERQEVEMCLNTNNALNELRITRKQPTTPLPKHKINGREIDNGPATIVVRPNLTSFYDSAGKKTGDTPTDMSGLGQINDLRGMLDDLTKSPTSSIDDARKNDNIIKDDATLVVYKEVDPKTGEYIVFHYDKTQDIVLTAIAYDNGGTKTSQTDYFYICSAGDKKLDRIVITSTEKSPYSNNYMKNVTIVKYHSIASSSR